MIAKDSLLPPRVVKVGTTLMREVTKRSESRSEGKTDRPAWKNIGRKQFRKGKGKTARFQTRLLAGSSPSRQTIDTCASTNVNFYVVKVAHSAPGHSQKRELNPGSAGCYCKDYILKYMKSVSCVT